LSYRTVFLVRPKIQISSREKILEIL